MRQQTVKANELLGGLGLSYAEIMKLFMEVTLPWLKPFWLAGFVQFDPWPCGKVDQKHPAQWWSLMCQSTVLNSHHLLDPIAMKLWRNPHNKDLKVTFDNQNLRSVTHKVQDPSTLKLAVRSSHDYQLTSSASNEGCTKHYHLPKPEQLLNKIWVLNVFCISGSSNGKKRLITLNNLPATFLRKLKNNTYLENKSHSYHASSQWCLGWLKIKYAICCAISCSRQTPWHVQEVTHVSLHWERNND